MGFDAKINILFEKPIKNIITNSALGIIEIIRIIRIIGIIDKAVSARLLVISSISVFLLISGIQGILANSIISSARGIIVIMLIIGILFFSFILLIIVNSFIKG